MKIAARILVVLSMIVSVVALTAATSSAATSKDEGHCHSSNVERSLEEPGGFDSYGTLKHKFNQNNDQFDLRCSGQNMYLEQGTNNNDRYAFYVCRMMGFSGYDYYFGSIPGEVINAKVKVNANGKFTIKCRYDASESGSGG